MKKILLPIIILLASSIAFAQDGFVEAKEASLFGTPSSTGAKVASLKAKTEFYIIAKDGPWYLVQSPEYIGWISVTAIRITDTQEVPQLILFNKAKISAKNAFLRGGGSNTSASMSSLAVGTQLDVVAHVDGWYLVQTATHAGWVPEALVTEILPKGTTADLSPTDSSLFEVRNDAAGGNPRITVRNNADQTLQLTFGGIEYVIPPGRGRYLVVPEGRYQYTAAGGGATPLTKVEFFQKGKIYGVTFEVK